MPPTIDHDEIDRRLESHVPTAKEKEQMEAVRFACRSLGYILAGLPESREKSEAVTHLEDVQMWGIKALTTPARGG